MLKRLIVIISLVMLVMASSVVMAQEPVQITMWTWFDDFRNVFPEVVEEWNATHPNIQVEQQIFSLNEYLQIMETSVAANEEPDIFGPHVHVKGYGEAGVAIDFYNWLDEDFINRFEASTINQFTWNGHLYALPWTAQTFGIFYNKDIFEEMNLEIPETWDDLIEVAHKIREQSNVIQPIAFGNRGKWLGCDFFLPLITQVTDDPTLVLELDRDMDPEWDVSWNSEPVIEALELVDRLVKAEVFAPGINGLSNDQAVNMFYMGRAAMLISGSWMPSTIDLEAPDTLNWDVFQMPAYREGARHWTGDESGANLAVSKRSEHIEEALEFLKYLYSSEVYKEAMIKAKGMPAMEETVKHLEDPIVKKMASWLVDGAPHILYGEGTWDAVANAVQGLMGGQLTPEEAAAQIQRDVEKARNM
jgi:ABC-type glycerol-3-phosphate transport system substrate-binding protein